MTVADMKTRVAVLQAQADTVAAQEQEVLREATLAGVIPDCLNDPVKVADHLRYGIDRAKTELGKLEAEVRELSAKIIALLGELDTSS